MRSSMKEVESFKIDHTMVVAPFIRLAGRYVGEQGDVVTKFDIRVTQPNEEFIPIAAMHSIEHVFATTIRSLRDDVIDFSGMCCQTGFYLTIFSDLTVEAIAPSIMKCFSTMASWESDDPSSIPGCSEIQCGNYRSMDVKGMKYFSSRFLDGISNKGYNP